MHQPQSSANVSHNKNTPGRRYVLIVYFLYLGSVLSVVTALLGVLLAHLKRHKYSPWIDTHLRFQIRTFWLGLAAGMIALAVWNLLGYFNAPPAIAWTLGYLFFTAALVWMVGRCGLGIHRLTSNRPIDAPASLGFGASISFRD